MIQLTSEKALYSHSYKKREDSLETQAVLIEIFMLYLSLPSGPKNRGHFKKNLPFPEENMLFAGDFRANLDETNADMVQFTNTWN